MDVCSWTVSLFVIHAFTSSLIFTTLLVRRGSQWRGARRCAGGGNNKGIRREPSARLCCGYVRASHRIDMGNELPCPASRNHPSQTTAAETTYCRSNLGRGYSHSTILFEQLATTNQRNAAFKSFFGCVDACATYLLRHANLNRSWGGSTGGRFSSRLC